MCIRDSLQLINGGHQLPLLRIVQLVGQQVFPVEGAPGGFPADVVISKSNSVVYATKMKTSENHVSVNVSESNVTETCLLYTS